MTWPIDSRSLNSQELRLLFKFRCIGCFFVMFFVFLASAKVGDDRRLLGFAFDPLGVQDGSRVATMSPARVAKPG